MMAKKIAAQRGQLAAKRGFDILVSGMALLVLWPLLLLVALVIALDSPGGVFFLQTRVGRYEKPFRIFKFRTMTADAESKGAQITVGADPRVTRSGKWLRASKIDELPQLINVLIGDMSFVGPRPEVPRYVAYYTEAQRQVFLVRPGITDAASIAYRHESELLAQSEDPERTYREQIMQDKLRINLEYIEHISFWGDIRLILKTLGRLFS